MSLIQIKPEIDADEKPDWLELVHRQVGSLRCGFVQIGVHDSMVTQIKKNRAFVIGEVLQANHLKANRETGGQHQNKKCQPDSRRRSKNAKKS